MNLERDKLHVPIWLLWVAGLSLVTAVLGFWYYEISPENSKLVGLLGGVVGGLIVYLATFLTVLGPIKEMDRFHRMGIKGLLSNRHEQTYYRELIGRSRLRVDVMGASCSRFVKDFLDVDSDDRVLVDAMERDPALVVRLLVPNDEHLSEQARNLTKETLGQVAACRARFQDRVTMRRFADRARHSFVITDTDLIAGPVFDEDKSKHAPAVHVATDTRYGQKYAEYFEKTWNSADRNA